MRRLVHQRQILAFLGFFAVVMAVALVARAWVVRPTVQDVRLAVERGPSVGGAEAGRFSLAGVELPDWTTDSWTLSGGRTDLLEDDRDAITGYYRHGGETIALTVIEGGEALDDDEPTRIRTATGSSGAGDAELVLGGATGGFTPSESQYGSAPRALGDAFDCAEGCGDRPRRPVLSVRRTVGDGAVAVLTGWPVTDGLFTRMQTLALGLPA